MKNYHKRSIDERNRIRDIFRTINFLRGNR